MKAIVDYLSDAELAEYNEILARAQENKANAPKAPRVPKVKTPEEAKNAIEKKMAKLQEQLAALGLI